jgi:hypothetical protein
MYYVTVVKNVVSNVLSSPSFIIYCYGDNSHLDGEYRVNSRLAYSARHYAGGWVYFAAESSELNLDKRIYRRTSV